VAFTGRTALVKNGLSSNEPSSKSLILKLLVLLLLNCHSNRCVGKSLKLFLEHGQCRQSLLPHRPVSINSNPEPRYEILPGLSFLLISLILLDHFSSNERRALKINLLTLLVMVFQCSYRFSAQGLVSEESFVQNGTNKYYKVN